MRAAISVPCCARLCAVSILDALPFDAPNLNVFAGSKADEVFYNEHVEQSWDGNMASESYHKGKWKADVGVEELGSGKFQGFVMLVHEDGPSYGQQALHRTTDVSPTMDAALAEAKLLAHHLLGNL